MRKIGPLTRLLRSSKVLLATVGVVQTLVFHYTGVDPEVWAAIDALIVSVIASIAYEDGKTKEGTGMSPEVVPPTDVYGPGGVGNPPTFRR